MKSKYHFGRTYLSTYLIVLFFLALGVFMILLIRLPHEPGKKTFPLVVGGIVFVLMAIYIVYSSLKQLPVITIDDAGISLNSLFRDEQIVWNEIESAKYTGKASFNFLFGHPVEAVTLKLMNGQIVKIFYEYYSNAHIIKQFIESYLTTSHAPTFTIEDQKLSEIDISGELFTTYIGQPLLSLRGISLWGMALILIYPIMTKPQLPNRKSVVPLLIFCSFWYLVNSQFCHYIKLSNSYLQVRNYFLPWKKRSFLLSDISHIIIDTKPKWPNCIRIITKSHRSRMYPCGTLYDSDWHNLMDEFRSKGIKVVNECI